MVTCLLNEKLPFFLPGTTTTSWKENSFCTDTRPCLTRYPLHTITMHAICICIYFAKMFLKKMTMPSRWKTIMCSANILDFYSMLQCLVAFKKTAHKNSLCLSKHLATLSGDPLCLLNYHHQKTWRLHLKLQLLHCYLFSFLDSRLLQKLQW